MASVKRSFGVRVLLAVVPLALIGGGLAVVWWLRGGGSAGGLRYGVTYEIWVGEAEVTPAGADGVSWDADGSAPDLRAVIVWQDQRIFETVTATDGLIAQWQPVGLKLTEVMKGEADAATVRRVGRVRPEDGGFIEVGLFDNDPVGEDWVAAFRVPWQVLRPGVNEIRDTGPLLRLRLVIVEPGAESAVMPVYVVEGADKLAKAPAIMTGGVAGGVAREAGERMDAAKDKALEKTGEAVDRVRGWLNRDRNQE